MANDTFSEVCVCVLAVEVAVVAAVVVPEVVASVVVLVLVVVSWDDPLRTDSSIFLYIEKA